MAEEDQEGRTEAATPARLSRARAEGHAPVSRELASLASLGTALFLVFGMAASLAGNATQQLGWLLANAGRIDSSPALLAGLRRAGAIAAGAFLPVALAVAAAGAGAILVQSRLSLRLTALTPDISRINPMRGLSRLFGPDHGVDALKSMVKIAALSLVLWATLSGQIGILPDTLREDFGAVSSRLRGGVIAIGTSLILVQAFITLLDLGWTQVSFGRSMRMSREEIKQEMKDSDGDPHVKAKRRAIRNARARQNLKKAMATATVVVTNPTHYAVALAYERNSAAAPRIVAKGMDELAARIREIAAERRVPIVPNPPLARALHRLELDSEIPAEHYKAVADIIAYIWRMEAQAARARML